MTKIITLKIKKISYSGDYVGPNFHITIDVLDKKTEVIERIEAGSTKFVNRIVFNQSCESDLLPVRIRIVEEDPLFDDVGTGQISMPLKNLSIGETHTTTVKVSGQGWEKSKTASITLEFEVSQNDGIRYASNADGRGWLLILLDEKSKETQIPFALKVRISEITSKREHFYIDEGPLKGQTASVRLKRGGSSFLLSDLKHKPAARLVFRKKKQTLEIEGLGVFKAKTFDSDPVKNGIHDIELPVSPHNEHGSDYLEFSIFAQSWFRVGHTEGRFLHCGSQSAGCITVTEPKKWTEIYNFLIDRRKDQPSVGTIDVTD